MNNQHRKSRDYKDLTQDELDLINEAKQLAHAVGSFVEKLGRTNLRPDSNIVDMNWVATGKIDLQKGFMALVRSIAKPESF